MTECMRTWAVSLATNGSNLSFFIVSVVLRPQLFDYCFSFHCYTFYIVCKMSRN